MADFDPGAACSSFRPAHAGRGRRRANALLFVSQATASGQARFVVKDYAAPGDGPGEDRARLQRELDGEAAFVAQGEAVLWPCAGPFEHLSLRVDGQLLDLGPSLVFPFLQAPTLYDVLREASASRDAAGGSSAAARAPDEARDRTRDDTAALLVRVTGRIAARHARARSVADLHSDGAAHNILVVSAPAPTPAARTASAAAGGAPPAEAALLWFDFAEPHAATDVAEARAVELLAFLLSVVEASRAGDERVRVAAVCNAYPDRAVLARVLAVRTPERPWSYALRHRLRLRSWLALWRGDTTQLARFRLLNALRHALARHDPGAPGAPAAPAAVRGEGGAR